MARGKRSTHPFDTEAKRRALPARREPHWHPLGDPPASYLGLYIPEGSSAPTWRVRVRCPALGRYLWEVLGSDHEVLAAEPTLSDPFAAALARARTRARQLLLRSSDSTLDPEPTDSATADTVSEYRYQRTPPRDYTIGDALADHARALVIEGKIGSAHALERAAAGPLFSSLARRPVLSLRTSDLIAWRDRLAASAPLRRSSLAAPTRKLAALPADADPEARRRRRVRVNRYITDLKAALNRLSRRVDWIPADTLRALAALEKFRDVGRGKVRPLDPDEVSRLLAVCAPAFADLVRGALLTGARVSELARLRVTDYDRKHGKVRFPKTKDEPEAGRVVALSDEGMELFNRLTAGRAPDSAIFERTPGNAWTTNTHIRPMREAVERARLSTFPSRPTFHNLRDTFACSLLRAGVSMDRVSKLLGHSTVGLTEKHYARFAETDLDAAARSLPRFEAAPARVESIAAARSRRRAQPSEGR